VHEIKHDGYRLMVRAANPLVRLFTRRGLRLDRSLSRNSRGCSEARGFAVSGLRPVAMQAVVPGAFRPFQQVPGHAEVPHSDLAVDLREIARIARSPEGESITTPPTSAMKKSSTRLRLMF
jgi:hypothetical protein